MVKTLKEPGPWLFCYSLTVVSCSSPLLSRPTQVTFFSGLELAWQVSLTSLDAVVSCLKGILRTLRILDAVPEHPSVALFWGCMWCVLPLPWERPVLCSLIGVLSTSSCCTVCILWAHHDFVTLLGQKSAWWRTEELCRDSWKFIFKKGN